MVGQAAREELNALGYTCGVLELALVQPDLIEDTMRLCEDWHRGRASILDMSSPYSNFALKALTSDAYKSILEDIHERVDELAFSMAEAKSKRQAVAPSTAAASSAVASTDPLPTLVRPSSSPPVVDASAHDIPAHLPAPPAPVELGDDLLDDGDWALCELHGLDEQAVLCLKRLAGAGGDAKKVLAKLERKSDVRKPSQFVTIACRNAMDKLVTAAAMG